MNELDKFNEECGLIGVWNVEEAGNIAYLGLHAQQHRGQEGAGVVTSSAKTLKNEILPTPFSVYKGLGLVSEVFGGFDFSNLSGENALGHVRYTTAGTNILANVQPFYANLSLGNIAVAHNGNLVNAEELRSDLVNQGAIFATNSDTEVFLHLIARGDINNKKITDVVIEALKKVSGAYSLLLMFGDRLMAVRDPKGFRPLAMGSMGNGIVFASETCAFDLIGATYIRDVEPGELVEISSDNSITSYFPFNQSEKVSPCVFEFVYFSRPDSKVFGADVYRVRKNMGVELAKECPVDADIIVPVPDSGITAALGFSQASGIPMELGLIRNHYVGRTFIEPKQSIRDFGVKLKLNANPGILEGKKVVLVDDSIIRGTTSKKIVALVRQAGASEVHLRISSPPTTNPCYYGIDTPDKKELIASRMTLSDIASYVGVDSLGYLSMDGLYKAVGSKKGEYCDACFSGKYPVAV
jgi:amidophosphoribosyltransferase